ncbi:MAG: magnesium transporter [Alphaproteobacteria bacterium CG_4_10_14_0_2_um_filter_63_37]|nr:MAG: magnesium transporter [Proteobacteria bacterium CG1_02_64_396]PJA24044.1 MAG: magnesium transporter [Alphaproteobacteria bacterium CG_4_10_14_0_2_um_filter_63_37]
MPFTPKDPFDLLPQISERVQRRHPFSVMALLSPLHPADIARIIADLDADDRAWVVEILPDETRGEVLLELAEGQREDLLEDMSEASISGALVHLDSDDAADLLQELDDDLAQKIVSEMDAADRREVEHLLGYAEDTAGGLMQVELFKVREDWPPEKVMEVFRRFGRQVDRIHTIFLVDDDNHLKGKLSFRQLILAEPGRPVLEFADVDPVRVLPEVDQEEVARLFEKYDLVSLPVVDATGHLIGRITSDDIFDVITEEASEDIYRLGGVEGDDLEDAVLPTAARRGAWLFLNLITAISASYVISLFEATLAQVVALAILMPIVASMGGNAGTQTLTVIVRGLALGRITPRNAMPLVVKQVGVGMVNGLAFALVLGVVASWWFPDLGSRLGVVIGLAMMINLLVAGLAGSLIPLALKKMNIDPALASGILLTTLTDVIGFFAFLGLAQTMLLGS